MKVKLKKIISILLSVFIFCAFVQVVNAQDTPKNTSTLSANPTIRGKPGGDFTVEIKYDGLKPLWALNFSVGYDHDYLILKSWSAGEMFFEEGEVQAPEFLDNFKYVFEATKKDREKCSFKGTVVSLVFTVDAKAPETTYPIELEIIDSINPSNEPIKTEAISSVLSVEQDVYSADITWGSMEFEYSDGTWQPETHSYVGSGWTPKNDNSNNINIKNNGNVSEKISLGYTQEITEVSAIFKDNDTELSSFELAENGEKNIKLSLDGKPNNQLNNQKLGSVTITLGEIANE